METILSNGIFNPKIIKNIIKKKSLSGLILALISTLYGETDKTTPATNAPISSENPKYANKAAKIKHQQTENKNNNSCDLATLFAIRGIMKNPIIPTIKSKAAPEKRVWIAKELKFPPFEKDEINISAPIATKSCIIKIPIEILPGSESSFPLSDNNFIMIIVDENDRAIAIYIAGIIS